MKKANRPVPMQPRLVYETTPAWVARLAHHVIHAGLGAGSQATAHQNYLLPHAAPLRYSGTLPTSIPDQRACRRLEIRQPFKSTKPTHPPKVALTGTFAVWVRRPSNLL